MGRGPFVGHLQTLFECRNQGVDRETEPVLLKEALGSGDGLIAFTKSRSYSASDGDLGWVLLLGRLDKEAACTDGGVNSADRAKIIELGGATCKSCRGAGRHAGQLQRIRS